MPSSTPVTGVVITRERLVIRIALIAPYLRCVAEAYASRWKLRKSRSIETLNHTDSNQGDTTMLTRSKIALIAVLLAGATSVGAAQARTLTHETFRSAPVRLQNEQGIAPNTSPVVNENNWYQTDV